jgi:hypothetical protein
MPTVTIENYKFRFYSSDVRESPQVHVIRDDSVAKIWLQPVVAEYNRGSVHDKTFWKRVGCAQRTTASQT